MHSARKAGWGDRLRATLPPQFAARDDVDGVDGADEVDNVDGAAYDDRMAPIDVSDESLPNDDDLDAADAAAVDVQGDERDLDDELQSHDEQQSAADIEEDIEILQEVRDRCGAE